MPHRISPARIREAAGIIDPVFLDSPQFVAESLSRALGARIVVKDETQNPIKSFKGRGAGYFVSTLAPGSRLITASAGNFGQAMGYACRQRGVTLTVYASTKANALKVERMRALGADVILTGRDFDEAKLAAKAAARAAGARIVEDSLDVETAEGAGTIGLELARFPEPIDLLAVSLGNGALACGVGVYLQEASPATRIVAVQAAGAPAMIESWRTGKLVSHEAITTIADGIGVRLPIPVSLEDMRGVIDEGLLVREESLQAAMRLAHEHLGLAIEPSGVAGLAAVMEHPAVFAGKTVAVILTGGNLTPEQIAAWLA